MREKKLYVICRHYRAQLKLARKDTSCVSAGELAKRMGISRTTAKKNLEMCARLGYVLPYEFIHINGMKATAYMPSVELP